MRVKEVMSKNPVCCQPQTSLQEAARLMADNDCGALPVVQKDGRAEPVGIITDRDITCRIVAQGKNPLQARVADAMSPSPMTVSANADLEECKERMEQSRVRRVIVVDDEGSVCGMIAQADIAESSSPEEAGEMVREISQQSDSPSAAH